MRRALLAVLAAALLLAGCNGADEAAEAPPPEPGPTLPAEEIERRTEELEGRDLPGLTMTDFEFDPKRLDEVPAGASFVLKATNRATGVHNFTIEDLPLSGTFEADVQPGETRGLGFVAPPPGTYEFYCKYHRGRGMTGTLVTKG